MDERHAVEELNNPYAQIAAQAGALDGLRTALFLQVGRRFGPMPDADRALVGSLDRTRLEELAIAIVEADSYSTWQARLQQVAAHVGGQLDRW